MDNDFNMPGALAVLFDMVRECNKLKLSDGNTMTMVQLGQLRYAMEIIKEISDIFGLTFLKKQSTSLSDNDIALKISFREALKKEKKYQQADEIRKKLKEEGVVLEDAKDGKTTWRRES